MNEQINYILSLVNRFMDDKLSGSELVVLLNRFRTRKYDYKEIEKTDPGLADMLENFFEDISYFEPDEKIRKESSMYYGEEKLREIVTKLIQEIN